MAWKICVMPYLLKTGLKKIKIQIIPIYYKMNSNETYFERKINTRPPIWLPLIPWAESRNCFTNHCEEFELYFCLIRDNYEIQNLKVNRPDKLGKEITIIINSGRLHILSTCPHYTAITELKLSSFPIIAGHDG